MRLRVKFSLLIAACVLLAVMMTTYFQSRTFVSDQRAYLSDFQSSLVLFTQRQIETRLNLLYSQIGETFRSTSDTPLLPKIPGCIGGKILPLSDPSSHAWKGASHWTLAVSERDSQPTSVLWIGRYPDHLVILDLKSDWFSDILESTHGASLSLILRDGSLILQAGRSSIHGKEFFHSREILAQAFQHQNGGTQTQRYSAVDGKSFLGTFLALQTDPPIMIAATTPWSQIEDVIKRTYRQSTWIAASFLLIAIIAGLFYSTSLTSPLQALVAQSIQVSKGNFNALAEMPSNRRDEVGILWRAFSKMIRELTKIRDELKRTERLAALGKFSSSIAHEIKNPLGSILGNTQVARRKLKAADGRPMDTEAIFQALDFVEEETHRANHIISRLMKFSRQEKPPQSPIDLAERIRRSLAIIRPMVEQSGIEFTENIPDQQLVCVADGDQIHEVILNMVQNAIHAVKDSSKKEVSVCMMSGGDHISIEISDTGYGISSDVMEHLYEPFFTTKGIGEGTGLGLAVCHGIIVNHHGTIEVTSQPEKGTKFKILLPKSKSNIEPLAA